MAPLPGRKWQRKSRTVSTRTFQGGSRLSGGAQAKRGGRVSAAKGASRKFQGTRVEEESEDAADSDYESVETKSQYGESSNDSQGGESDETSGISSGSYNFLLQSLQTNKVRGETSSKKRKLEEFKFQQISEQEKRTPSESEESEEEQDLPFEDIDDDVAVGDFDPFTTHFAAQDERKLLAAIDDIGKNAWLVENRTIGADCAYSVMCPKSSTVKTASLPRRYTRIGEAPLKERLKARAEIKVPELDNRIGHLASHIFDYEDIFFPLRDLHNADTLRTITSLHAVNHILKTRDRVLKNNTRLTKENVNAELELRDQGFTRPKVLIVVPTRQSCARYVETILDICEPEQQENRKRFTEAFTLAGDEISDDKPADFRELFEGNDDDMFRLGVKFTRKNIKFFSQFYSSDIIFASPLGLRMAIGAEDAKKQDYDFLSSIEILLLDQADALRMQNWEHVEFLLDRLNRQPKEAHGCDFGRVRNWYLDGHAKYLRQTIILSAFNFPSLNKLYMHQCQNVAGRVKCVKLEQGAIVRLSVAIQQSFSRFEVASPLSEPDDRFNYFISATMPSITKIVRQHAAGGSGVLVFLPSYADFVRVRNHLATSSSTQHISFGSISEYTSFKDVARARSHFSSGRHSVLLYTERAHHFRRYHLRGVKKIIMYGLPENSIFYQEIVGGYLSASVAAAKLNIREANVRSTFSKFDLLKLERIVGSSRARHMLREQEGDVFDFV